MGIWHNVRIEVNTKDGEAVAEAIGGLGGLNDVILRSSDRGGIVVEAEVHVIPNPIETATQIASAVKARLPNVEVLVRIYPPVDDPIAHIRITDKGAVENLT
jgi:hypothetical protein